MPAVAPSSLEPRKTPVQARSAASVDAVLEATIQVLVAVGKERLTTTRVAERAGVSVGTLYQYFPNKSSLLQAALRRHFAGVAEAIERVCREQRGKPLAEMGAALARAFLAAKLADGKSGAALYAVSADVDGVEIAREMQVATHERVCALLLSSPERPADTGLVTTVLVGIMSGVSRLLLEGPAPEERFEAMCGELVAVVTAYLAGQARQ